MDTIHLSESDRITCRRTKGVEANAASTPLTKTIELTMARKNQNDVSLIGTAGFEPATP